MTALYLDDPLELILNIKPVEGVKMGNIMEILTKEAAYIEAVPNFNNGLGFYFCDKDGAYITVDDGNNRIYGYLSSVRGGVGTCEYAIYHAMRALYLAGKVEEVEDISFNGSGVVQILISFFPDQSDLED